MTSTQNAAAHVAAGVAVPAWLISLAVDTLPLIQWLAGLVAICSGVLAIVSYARRLLRDT